MADSIDLKCPVCGEIIKNICCLTVDWMTEMYCREYIRHVDGCRMSKVTIPGASAAAAMPTYILADCDSS
jgi:hypothetical protein